MQIHSTNRQTNRHTDTQTNRQTLQIVDLIGLRANSVKVVSVGLEIKIEKKFCVYDGHDWIDWDGYLHPQTEYLNWSAIFSTLVLFFGASYCDHCTAECFSINLLLTILQKII